jgi:alpha-N-arabinofuranosidase
MFAIPMRKIAWFAIFVVALIPVGLFSRAGEGPGEATVISVDAAHVGAAISPAMFGIFFEDINFGADGGLYPELVKNRSFEFQEPLTGWHEIFKFSRKGLERPKG